jgi:hypothetical protein
MTSIRRMASLASLRLNGANLVCFARSGLKAIRDTVRSNARHGMSHRVSEPCQGASAWTGLVKMRLDMPAFAN